MEKTATQLQNDNSSILTSETTKQEIHKRLFKRGCAWVGIGGLTLGLSFGITFLLFHQDKSFLLIMYLMTSVGAMCVLKGLVDILGF